MDMTVAPPEREVGSGEGPWELPAAWCWAPLRSLTSFIGRGRGPKYVEEHGVPVVNQKCIRWRKLATQHLRLTARDAFDRLTPELILRQGDLLWNSTGTGTIGRAVVYDGSIGELTVDSHVTIVRPVGIEPKYLGYFVETGRVQHLVDEAHVGSTNQRELPRAFVEDLLLPLAPFSQQRRIVASIDALFAEIAEGETAIEEARKGLETFNRALLKAAVTGELTSVWREKNKPTETGRDLLARLKAQRAAQISTGRRKRAQETEPLDTTDLPELPEGWAWAPVADVGSVQLGRQRAPQHHQGENMHSYLRVANVFEDRIDRNDVKKMNFTPAELKTFELTPGDILLNEGQTPDLLGRPAMWRSDERGFCFQNTLLRFRAFEPLDPEFCLLVFRHYLHAKRFKRESQITTNIAHLSSGRFSTIEFPVPPIEEQKEIVRLTQEGLASAADTRILLDSQLADAPRLRQAILKSAFEGKLVDQDPDDEPASVALARLRAAPSRATPRRGRIRAVREP